MQKLPKFIRQFVYDAVKGALMGIVLLNLPLAGSVPEATAQATLAATTIIRAIFGAAGFAIPAFLSYLSQKLVLDGIAPEPEGDLFAVMLDDEYDARLIERKPHP